MRNFFNLVKNKYFLFFLFIIFSVIPFIFLLFDYSIVQNSASFFTRNYHYFFNSLYTWNSQIFGIDSSASIWGLFPLGIIFYLFNTVIGINVNITQFFIFLFLFLIGFFSFFILIKELFKPANINNIAIFTGSLFFIYNLYIVTSAGSFHPMIPYVFLPLSFYLFIRGLNTNQLVKYAIFISLISLLTFGVNLVFDVILFFLLISYGLWSVFILKKVSFKRLMKFISLLFIFTLLAIAWWLIPFIYSGIINKSTILNVLSSEKFYNLNSSATNVLRNLGYWGFFSGHKGVRYYDFSLSYQNNFFIIFITFFIALIVFYALLLVRKIREKEVRGKLLFFYLLLIALLPFIGGTYKTWPTANLMQWCFDNIPFFSIFRNTYKWTSLVVFCYAIILTLFFYFIINLKTSNLYKKILLKYFLPCIFIVIIAINAFPLFTNKLFPEKNRVREIPVYWHEATAYINNNLNQDKNRLLLLPNQYFPVFIWNNEIKNFPSDMASALFKVSSVSNVPKGSGQIYSAELINFIYNNIGEENIDKFLGLLNISHILQRNDYYSDYYNVEKPETIKKILSGYRSLSLSKSFGMIDIYQIQDDLVYPRIYSPQNIVAIDNFDILRNNFDYLNSNNSRDKNLSFVFNSQIKSNDRDTKENSNYYKEIFQNENVSMDKNQLIDELEIPADGNYEIIDKNTDKKLSTNNYLDKISVYSDDSYSSNKFSMDNDIFLKRGHTKLQINLDNLIDNKNLLDNNSFELGFWQKEVSNCFKQNTSPNLAMNIVDDPTDGSKSLELQADKDIACTSFLPIRDFNKNNEYIFSIDYKIISGDEASFCIWDGKRCLKVEKMKYMDNNWKQHQVIIKPESDSGSLVIFLYAPANGNKTSKVRYDNLSIRKSNIDILDRYLIKTTGKKTLNAININNSTKINPTQYRLNLSSKDKSLLVFQESYHSGWRAFIQENKSPVGFWQNIKRYLGFWKEQEITQDKHIIANGYANGWWIDKTGDYELIIEFWPQRWFYLGLLISGLTLLGCILYLIFRRKEKNVTF